jgi:hypothetical protein
MVERTPKAPHLPYGKANVRISPGNGYVVGRRDLDDASKDGKGVLGALLLPLLGQPTKDFP